jgi:hypothetical protein
VDHGDNNSDLDRAPGSLVGSFRRLEARQTDFGGNLKLTTTEAGRHGHVWRVEEIVGLLEGP